MKFGLVNCDYIANGHETKTGSLVTGESSQTNTWEKVVHENMHEIIVHYLT